MPINDDDITNDNDESSYHHSTLSPLLILLAFLLSCDFTRKNVKYMECNVGEKTSPQIIKMASSSSLLDSPANNDPINEVPAEVWKMIFMNLRDNDDFNNVRKAHPPWDDLLYSTRATWMFQKVFPLLVPHLSKEEMWTTRLVSKHWCYGVDHFLDNNVSHRPFSTMSQYLRHDIRLALDKTLFQNDLLYRTVSYPCMEELFRDASLDLFPNVNPILGRSLVMFENKSSLLPSNTEFLEKIGKYLYFLKIKAVGIGKKEMFARILKLLCLAPNLKKLEIVLQTAENRLLAISLPIEDPVDICFSLSEPVDQFMQMRFVEQKEQQQKVETQICEDIDQLITQHKLQLPNLETFVLHTNKECTVPFKTKFLEMICLHSNLSNNLESLSLNHMSFPKYLEIAHLTELQFRAGSDTELKSLLDFNPTLKLRKLALQISNDVTCSVIMQTANYFKSTLAHLELEHCWRKREGCKEDNKVLRMKGALELPNLDVLTLKGYCPPSFNFICELKTLKYLQLHFKQDYREWQPAAEEIMDLYRSMAPVWGPVPQPTCPNLYTTNIWNFFPKLKVLTVQRCRPGYELHEDDRYIWEFRKNHQT